MNQIKFAIDAEQLYSASLSAPVATNQFVLAAHYDVSITSRLAKNIY